MGIVNDSVNDRQNDDDEFTERSIYGRGWVAEVLTWSIRKWKWRVSDAGRLSLHVLRNAR
jgi:hypothetical protein